ncbi:hypothetical protein [Enterovibrio norvegicus]|uniref:hypothetical protein n=1 Tax=Enterovibrio norvegicus TaxID=188144 RepID=UPI000C848955|nr:hypothetical protein [Enterovibrio norvegicus]PMH64524.1 hypothetical protein BCU62_15835 [Enterovibrio norvegicus]
MKKPLSILILTTMLFSPYLHAKGCKFGEQQITIGETISLADPYLQDEALGHYLLKGYSSKDSIEMSKKSDWTHLVLKCMNSFVQSNNASESEPFGMVEYGEPVLVPLSHQVEWVDELKIKN